MEKATVPNQDHHVRHQRVWTLVQPLVRLILWLRFRFKRTLAPVSGPFLLVSNHNTDWDPLMIHTCFKEQFYFVASEHLLRSGLGGKLVAWLQDPIPRQKSGGAADTVMTMMRRMRKGYGVCVFPEGNRSWDGTTAPFLASIGKLARSSGVPLVTYRLEGGYFASPRWSGNSARRGRMLGRVVNVYSPEELKSMKPAEICDHIREDIQEDAYARQRKDPVLFKGRRLAEHMETLLFLCPRCGRHHTLESHGDTVRCWKCGFSFTYLPTGFLSGQDIPFDNLRDWKRWQDGEIRRICDEADERPIFTDTQMRTDEVESSKRLKLLGKGDMRLYKDRLELPGVTLPIKEITGVAVQGPQNIYFTAGEHHYLVRSDMLRCTVKYLTACSHLNGDADYSV